VPTLKTLPGPEGELHRFVARPSFTVRYSVAHECRFEPHSHSAFTVTVVLTGRLATTIGNDHAELVAGQAGLTNVGQTHEARSRKIEFVSVGIVPDYMTELVLDLNLGSTSGAAVFLASMIEDSAVNSIAQSIGQEMKSELQGRDHMLDALGQQLMVHLIRHHLAVRRSPQIELSRVGPVDRRIRLAVEFMHDHYGQELSSEEIASSAFLSEYHFARLFKDLTGMTPGAYLTNVRLERARKLLGETDQPITRIAGLVGYQSQSHFTRLFKATTGLTPRDYRKAATLSARMPSEDEAMGSGPNTAR
jgi:AraC-like DNA-binding protein/quercetin dioxygenase-like cupin family protein